MFSRIRTVVTLPPPLSSSLPPLSLIPISLSAPFLVHLIAPILAFLAALVTGLAITATAMAQPLLLSKPGQSSLEWLLIEHEGAKGLRSGKQCVDCHADGLFSEPRKAELSIKGERGHLVVTIDIELKDPKRPSADFAILLGTPKAKSFARVGCWAACHSDMKYMDMDEGLGKYLAVTRRKMSRSGGGTELKMLSDLKMLRFGGRFLEMWQVRIYDGKVFTLWQEDLLESSKRLNMGTLQAKAKVKEGRLQLVIKRPFKVAENLIHFKPAEKYILGVALLSDEESIPTLEVAVGADAEKSGVESGVRSDSKNSKNSKKDTKDKSSKKDKKKSKKGGGDVSSEEGEPPLDPLLNPKRGPQHWVSFPIHFRL